MPSKKGLKSNEDALCGLRHIREFKLSADQIRNRYSVDNLNEMCYELGLPLIAGENEESKVYRIACSLSRCAIKVDFYDVSDVSKVDPKARHKEQILKSGCNCG